MSAHDPDQRLAELIEQPQPPDADDLAALLQSRMPPLERRWHLLALCGVLALGAVVWRSCDARTVVSPQQVAVVAAPDERANAEEAADSEPASPKAGGRAAGAAIPARAGDADAPAGGGSRTAALTPGRPARAADTPAPRCASAPGAASSTESLNRISLNSATLAQIDGLPGVGPVLAQRILTWRAAHRGFTDVHDLLEVKGIGPAKFAKLQSRVRVQ